MQVEKHRQFWLFLKLRECTKNFSIHNDNAFIFFHNRGKAKGPAAAQMWTNSVYLTDGASGQKWKQTISKLTER